MRCHSHVSAVALVIGLFIHQSAAVSSAPPSTDIRCTNINTSALPSMKAAAAAAGMIVRNGPPDSVPSGAVVVWQATNGAKTDITTAQAAELERYVRLGGSLLLSLDHSPGTGPMRLAKILPTTAWETQIEAGHRGGAEGPIQAIDGDRTFLGGADATGISLSYHYRIRPVDAVERGQARYERYARTIPFVEQTVNAGDHFWTRPLNNRDWTVRLRGSDVGRSPLLVTGRYGAGRVAVLAGSIADLDRSSAGKTLETGLIGWLTQRDQADAVMSDAIPSPEIAPPATSLDIPARVLHVTLRNPSATPMPIQLIARIMTWEPALIGDQLREVTLPPGGNVVVDLPLPALSATSYQANESRDEYTVRLGVLSQNGAVVLSETRVDADLRPAVELSVATDNLRAVDAAFPDAPGPQLQDARMGLPVSAYAYRPGQTVQATVTVNNGVRNIAPLAMVADETQSNNLSVGALNDLAAVAGKGPIDTIAAFGNWVGTVGRENILRFTFPQPVHISSVTLVGIPATDLRNIRHNPGAVVIEADGHDIAHADGLDARFASGNGQVTLSFEPTTATVMRVRIPWFAAVAGVGSGSTDRQAPWLGEVDINGSVGDPPHVVEGAVQLTLRDALTGASVPAGSQELTVAPGKSESVKFPVELTAAQGPHFYRLEAKFREAKADVPVMAIVPAHTLLANSAVHPPDAAELNFIVTRGFRNASDVGTGTQETHGSWEEPDDLVWAYSRRLKQTGVGARTLAGRLYVTDADFRHYSTPWDTYLNGESFYADSIPNFIARIEQTKRGRDAKTVILNQGDRWDTGPSVVSLYNWQDFIAFDAYLRSRNLSGLKGRTREEISAEIDRNYPGYWQAWQLSRYTGNVEAVRDGFATAGKRLVISAQGIPLVPISKQDDLAATIRGMSDDSTWGMSGESVPLTTGREMTIMAYNPVWGLSTLLQWGWNSAILNFGFHTPVGTTEPSRRHYYDRAWRGIVAMDGGYRSMHTYGYNRNGGEAYTMTDNDWQEWSRLQDRHSLIYPDGPIGVGVVLSSSRLEDPAHAAFSGGGMGGSQVEDRVMQTAEVLRRLHEAGVSVPFTANAAALSNWAGQSPLLILNLAEFSPAEIVSLTKIAKRGVKMAAFVGDSEPSPAAKALFARPGMLLLPGDGRSLTISEASAVAKQLRDARMLPIVYPEGTAGYGFAMQGLSCIEIEDWLEQGRNVSVRLRANPGAVSVTATEINDHRTLAVRRDGADWVIDLPIRPGDGDLICVKESK